MSLSLLDNQTRVSPGNFFPQFGGGGGGGTVVTTSNLVTSTISAPSGSVEVLSPFIMNNNSITWNAGSVSSLTWLGNDGALVGVSTINGASYPPASGAYPKISSLQGVGSIGFTNVSTGSGLQITSLPVPMKLSHQYIVSGVLTYSVGDSSTGVSFQSGGGVLTGGVVMASNANGASFTWSTSPSVSDTTPNWVIATTSPTPASGFLTNLTVTDLGVLSGSL
jgi:hypothetical protein